MNRIVKFLKDADVYNRKGIFLSVWYLFLCWVMYQAEKSIVSLPIIILGCIGGMIFGLLLIAKIAVPYSRWIDLNTEKLGARLSAWMNKKFPL